MNIEDIAALVDEHTDRGVILQHSLFGQLAQLRFAFDRSLAGRFLGLPAFQSWWDKCPYEKVSTANILFPKQLRLAVQRFKKVLELAHCLRGTEEEKSVPDSTHSGRGG